MHELIASGVRHSRFDVLRKSFGTPRFHSSHIDFVNGPARFHESTRFIGEELGVRPFSLEELDRVSQRYSADLVNGMRHKGNSSLAMYDTLLPQVDREKLPQNKPVLVLEVGGTNIRAAIVEAADKKLQIKTDKNHKELLFEEKLDKIVYSSADEFFDHLVEKFEPFLRNGLNPTALGIIWSFPGESKQRNDGGVGVDIQPTEKLTKEFVIPGIGSELVGQAVLQRLVKKFGYSQDIPFAVMNDTRAVEGGINGTGFNLAFGRYNTESGGFTLPPELISWIYQEVDRISGNTGLQIAEKEISGKYLQMLMDIGARRLVERGLITQKIGLHTSKFMSQILRGVSDRDISYEYLDPYSVATLTFLAQQAAVPSAQLVGTMVGTGIITFPKVYTSWVTQYPFDGSVFRYIPGYQQTVEQYANRIANTHNIHVMCPAVENAGIIGAAASPLAMMQELQNK